MPIKPIVVTLGLCAAVAACGETTGQQALFGGSAGALGGAAVGANPIATAAVGAGANVLYCQQNPGKCN
ncbi:MAG: hypothetical protein CML66_29410 [Rhodobacteraceae bacterium]|nr:hypothetical protein [Paracoccaceae bacterium]MAY45824.1 hypothetical protein [Paracoccaceae bacterium]QEW19214.1 hypothetical protein LA6_001397 [Marinibacterium anthonyi]